MSNLAKDIIWPADQEILVRIVFLYVGQGESTLVIVRDNARYKTLLVDINRDEQCGGIDVARLVADLLEDRGNDLDVFMNTHPHNDHLAGIIELSEAVNIKEVWHSGHVPGKEHYGAYDNLRKVIHTVRGSGGSEVKLQGSRSIQVLGEANYFVFAPAEYVTDDIMGEAPEERYRRVHEQCAVMKIGTGSTWAMLTGDSDRDAWEKHIMYHGSKLKAQILSAPHHGSRSFFRHNEDEEPYLDALEEIDPVYVVVSAPTQKESQWDHPHEDALELYTEKVGKDNILHTGECRYCFICDIFSDGVRYRIEGDGGTLAEEYGLDNTDGDGDKDGGLGGKLRIWPPKVSSVDRRPMGSR